MRMQNDLSDHLDPDRLSQRLCESTGIIQTGTATNSESAGNSPSQSTPEIGASSYLPRWTGPWQMSIC